MKFEDFWEIYMDRNARLVDNYDAFKATFSKKLPPEIAEEYYLPEVMTEFTGYYETAGKYEEIVEFYGILKENNPEVLQETVVYFYDFLVEYYCYHHKEEKLKSTLQDFAETAIKEYDLFLRSLKISIHYGHSELTGEIIEKIYDLIKDTPDILDSATYELGIYKYQIELEKVYKNYLDQGEFAWDNFIETIEKYDFNIDEKERGLLTHRLKFGQEKSTYEQLHREPDERRKTLSMAFLAYMHSYQMSFPTSGEIWELMYQYWGENNKRNGFDRFFILDRRSFKEFILGQSGFLVDYRFLTILTLWGSAYVYDFLKKLALISEEDYNVFQEIIKNLKETFIKEDPSILWRFSFVHRYKKPDFITDEIFEQEKEAFKKEYAKLRDEIGDGFFYETPQERQERLDAFFNPKPQKPKRRPKKAKPKKIGRNEKVTVKYQDGTIKENVKFKQVFFDVQTGKCEIVGKENH